MVDAVLPGVNAGAFYGALLRNPVPTVVRHADGRAVPLPIERYLGSSTNADAHVASVATGPVLDVGCGPGRLLDELRERGVWALGLDRSRSAVAHARRHGRRAIHGDVFGPVPAAGHWSTILLLDGNIGIGGDAAALLERLTELRRPGGTILAEVDPPGAASGSGAIRLECDRRASSWFAWASVGHDAVATIAAAAGLKLRRTLRADGRWFACLS